MQLSGNLATTSRHENQACAVYNTNVKCHTIIVWCRVEQAFPLDIRAALMGAEGFFGHICKNALICSSAVLANVAMEVCKSIRIARHEIKACITL